MPRPHPESRDSSRLEYWGNGLYVTPATTGAGADDGLQQAWSDRIRSPLREPRSERNFDSTTIWDTTREAIFDIVEGKPVLHLIGYLIDLGTAELYLGPTLDVLGLEDVEELKKELAFAHIAGVPVVPNTPSVAAELAAHERDLFATGFALGAGDDRKRMVLTAAQDLDLQSADVLGRIPAHVPISQGQMRLALQAARRELDARSEAGRILASIRLAISELRALLGDDRRNENALQRCLTRHPVLFGPDYAEVLPKHRLGGDYELDYALRRASGQVDLVEIEASTHKLFTQKGHVTAPLAQAEQQVMDWLAWLEKYGGLARRDLPELQRPAGYIVIGLDRHLDDQGLDRLRQRNAIFSGALTVMTYDGLLRRAEALLSRLEGLARASNGASVRAGSS